MDILFDTYYCPKASSENFGIKEEFPQTYFGQLLKPLIPAKSSKMLK